MSIIVRAIDVGFGNTKYVSASAQGQLDCAHFPSLTHFGQDEIPVESMGGRRRTVQVTADGLLYEAEPDVEFAAARFRSRQQHDGYTQTVEYRALATGALHFMKVETADLLVVGLPGVSVHSQARGTPESDYRDLPRRPQAMDRRQAGTRRAAAPGRALLVCAAEPERWLAQPTR